jgi:hypothetical protein
MANAEGRTARDEEEAEWRRKSSPRAHGGAIGIILKAFVLGSVNIKSDSKYSRS